MPPPVVLASHGPSSVVFSIRKEAKLTPPQHTHPRGNSNVQEAANGIFFQNVHMYSFALEPLIFHVRNNHTSARIFYRHLGFNLSVYPSLLLQPYRVVAAQSSQKLSLTIVSKTKTPQAISGVESK